MPRPLLPDHLRKHPRVLRRSTTIGEVLDIPKPSKAQIAYWKSVVEMCTHSILAQPSRNFNKAKKSLVSLRAHNSWKAPKGFPGGRASKVDGEFITRQYNPEGILLWLYMNKLAPESPHDLYVKRGAYVRQVHMLDKDFDDCLMEEFTIVV